MIGELNDRAYGLPTRPSRLPSPACDDPAVRGFVARLDGVPVACLATVDGPDGDCALELVATLPRRGGAVSPRASSGTRCAPRGTVAATP